MAFSTNGNMRGPQYRNNIFKKLSPAQTLVLGFAALILLGTIILSLPVSSASGEFTNIIDSLFTATSAVCVTGLVVVDTGTHFSVFGQVVIMILIQFGGLGFMTMATLFFLIMGKRINLKGRLIIQEALNQLTIEGVVRLVKWVIVITLAIEGIAALVLASRFWPEYGFGRGLYYGLFHSVSAFNNAGFDLFGEFRSLTIFVSDFTVNLTIGTLFIIGGLGFTVLVDIYTKKKWKNYSLHTKVVLTTTVALICVGTISVFLLEYNNSKTLAPLSLPAKLMASWFQGVTPRTAGFNTLDTAGLRSATQFMIIILMFIGASPGSTGGGIKTATFGTLIAATWAMVRGKKDVELFERRIPSEIVFRSLTIGIASLTVVILVTMFLSITENADFLVVLFEATSAFGTVGLSMGLTTKLSLLGKIVVALTMFAGRIGPLTVAFALAQKHHKAVYRLAEERIMVG